MEVLKTRKFHLTRGRMVRHYALDVDAAPRVRWISFGALPNTAKLTSAIQREMRHFHMLDRHLIHRLQMVPGN